jgi:hypothetical protein
VIADQRARLEGRTAGISGARGVAIVGIVLGLLAVWVTLPPWTVRDLAFPLALGFLAVALGIFAFARD